jgi:uncharacterized protein YxjI
MRDKIIRIHWAEPQLIEDAIASPLSMNPGLYYITRLFGSKETSLYIGKSAYSVRKRLLSHDRHWVHDYRGKIFIRIGQVIYPVHPDAEIIDHAESALIYEHRNILTDNTDKLYSYSYSELFHIENKGNIFELKPSFRMHDQ